jgi:hypothetical protein
VSVGATINYDGWDRDEGIDKLEKPAEPSPFSLKIRAEGASGSSAPPQVHDVKPGNNPASAAAIPGSGLVVGDIKFGESAYFSVPVTKGEVLQVGMAVQKPFQKRTSQINQGAANAEYKLLIYDDDQVEVARKELKLKENPPDAGGVSVSWPVTLSGKATIVASLEENTKLPAGPGRLAILVSKPGSEASAAGETSADKPKRGDAFSGAEGKSK